MDFMNVFLKLLIGYSSIIVYFKLVGRAAMAPATASDQVQNFFLGGMAGAVILNFSITPIQFLLILIIWFAIIVTVNFLKLRVSAIRNLVEGNSIELYSDKKMNKKAFLKAKLSANDFTTLLRNNGVTSIKNLRNVRIEANGQLAVSEIQDDSFNKYLILDGLISYSELEEIGKTKKWLEEKLKSEGITSEQVFILEYNLANDSISIINNPTDEKNSTDR